jgi:hypothetical protein
MKSLVENWLVDVTTAKNATMWVMQHQIHDLYTCNQQAHCKGTIDGQLDRCWSNLSSYNMFILFCTSPKLSDLNTYRCIETLCVGLQCFLVLTCNSILSYRMEPVLKSILVSYITIRLVALHMEHNPNVFFNHGLIDLGHKYHCD